MSIVQYNDLTENQAAGNEQQQQTQKETRHNLQEGVRGRRVSTTSATFATRLLGLLDLPRKQQRTQRAVYYNHNTMHRGLALGGHGKGAQHMRE